MLLKHLKESFKAAPVSSSLAYLTAGLMPNNPLVTYETGTEHLRSAAFLTAAMEHRARHTLLTLSARLRKHTGRLGAWRAWNKCLNHVIQLANAHVESLLVQQFLRAVDNCVDPDCRRALKAMADLYALGCIKGDVAFRNDDYIAPAKAKAIARLCEVLCAELRSVALPLVNAFAIPDHILRAPIGLGSSSASDFYKEYLSAAGFEI